MELVLRSSSALPDSSWDTTLDASYKSIDDDQRDPQRAGRYDTSDTVPLVPRHPGGRPPSVSILRLSVFSKRDSTLHEILVIDLALGASVSWLYVVVAH